MEVGHQISLLALKLKEIGSERIARAEVGSNNSFTKVSLQLWDLQSISYETVKGKKA